MIIKKFTGKTEAEAVEAAKKELGEGLVIMNVRQVKPKGLFAAFKAKQTEVTAALEDEPENIRTARREQEQPAAETPRTEPKPAVRTESGAEAVRSSLLSGQSSIEKKLDSLQTLLESSLKESIEEPAEEENPGAEDQAASRQTQEDEQEKFIRLLYSTMIENEVAEKYANQILEDVDKNRKPNIPFDYLLANVYQKIILKFGKSEGIVPASKGSKIVFFIGPTGVGKTTTIAKLASSFVMDEKKKVALLTTDTYRIAAAEQLRTYAQILEVPFRVIYSPEEFREAVDSLKEFDYIFVDTAGHSHQNEERLEGLKQYVDSLESSVEIQTFLVLSATTKYKDLLNIADNYGEVAEYQIIFTKLDETTTLGNLLNLKLHTDTPIAYITYGQNVPNDIERFNPQKTVKQLLGGKA